MMSDMRWDKSHGSAKEGDKKSFGRRFPEGSPPLKTSEPMRRREWPSAEMSDGYQLAGWGREDSVKKMQKKKKTHIKEERRRDETTRR